MGQLDQPRLDGAAEGVKVHEPRRKQVVPLRRVATPGCQILFFLTFIGQLGASTRQSFFRWRRLRQSYP
jgi:hypothetical protein